MKLWYLLWIGDDCWEYHGRTVAAVVRAESEEQARRLLAENNKDDLLKPFDWMDADKAIVSTVTEEGNPEVIIEEATN